MLAIAYFTNVDVLPYSHQLLLLGWITVFEGAPLLAWDFRPMALQKEEHTSSTGACSETLTMASTKTKKEIKNVFCICKLSLSLEHWKGRRTKDRTRVQIKRWVCRRNPWEKDRKEEGERNDSHWHCQPWWSLWITCELFLFLVIFCFPGFLHWEYFDVLFKQVYCLGQTQMA